MDLLDRLDELTDILETARSVPLSTSCVVPRDEALDLLDEIRAALPDAVREADQIVRRRDEILEGVERGSAMRMAEAETRADRLVTEAIEAAHRRVVDATAQAEQIVADARRQADLIVANHATTLAAQEAAARLLNDAQRKASEIMAATTTHANAVFSEAETTLLTLVQNVRGQHAQVESMAASGTPTLGAHPDLAHVDLTTRDHEPTRRGGATEFYNLELDEMADYSQPPGLR